MLDEGRYITPIQSKHNLGWKANQFKSDNASMLVHGSGVSQYPQIYEKFKKLLLPHTYVESYSGENVHQFLQK